MTSPPPPSFMGRAPAQSSDTTEPERIEQQPSAESAPPVDERLRTLRAAAKWYTSMGLSVVRAHYPSEDANGVWRCSCGTPNCKVSSKHPAHGVGKAEESIVTLDDIDEEWNRPWNIFIRLKDTPFIIIDIDPRNGGNASFEDIKKEVPWVEDTFHYFTSDGGRHYYFKIDKNALTAKSSPRPGIDFKVNSGVIAAPSRHKSGLIYTRGPVNAIKELSIAETKQLSMGVVGKTPVKRPERTRATIPSVSRVATPWTDHVETADKATYGMGVAAGGTLGYDNLCQQVLDGEEGAASRIVEFYDYHGTLPEQSVKLTHGGTGRNDYMSQIIGRVARECLGGDDELRRAALEHLWRQEGGDPQCDPGANIIFPKRYENICIEVSEKFTEPVYHIDEGYKFRSMMTRFMLKEWGY